MAKILEFVNCKRKIQMANGFQVLVRVMEHRIDHLKVVGCLHR